MTKRIAVEQDDDDDDESMGGMGGHHGPQTVQCANQ